MEDNISDHTVLLSACIAAEHYLVGLIDSYWLGCECSDDHPIIQKLRDAISQAFNGQGLYEALEKIECLGAGANARNKLAITMGDIARAAIAKHKPHSG